jgi:hypothetical protein
MAEKIDSPRVRMAVSRAGEGARKLDMAGRALGGNKASGGWAVGAIGGTAETLA